MCVCAYLFLQYGVFTPTITSHNISLFFLLFFYSPSGCTHCFFENYTPLPLPFLLL